MRHYGEENIQGIEDDSQNHVFEGFIEIELGLNPKLLKIMVRVSQGVGFV